MQYWYCRHRCVSRSLICSTPLPLITSTKLNVLCCIIVMCSEWLCLVIKFNVMTNLFKPVVQYNCMGASLMEMPIRWLATILWHYDTSHIILSMIKMNVILFCVWITAQNFVQNVWGKGDNFRIPMHRLEVMLKWMFNKWSMWTGSVFQRIVNVWILVLCRYANNCGWCMWRVR
jgi:hypothetical protein